MKIYPIHQNNNNITINDRYIQPSFKNMSAGYVERVLLNMGFSKNYAKSVMTDIIKTYNKPERGYHNIEHISNMLKSFEEFVSVLERRVLIKNADEFKFAILMHDYVNGETDDVEKSALKAGEFVHKISPDYNSHYIEKLILATDYSKKQSLDFEQQLMQDIDIEILGKPFEEYNKYSENIRNQYVDYPDKIYNPARIKILKHFIDKENIYNTEFYRNKYEIQARKNIEQEIVVLSK